MENFEVYEIVNMIALFIGITFGAIGQKTQFCFSGGIKDYFLSHSTKRISSIILAMIVAIVSTSLVSGIYEIDLTNSVYFRDNINYITIILGGILFGIGMMISDGCSSRHIIKFAQGDGYSLVVVITIALFAYATTQGILSPISRLLTQNDSLLMLSSIIENFKVNVYLMVVVLIICLLMTIQWKFKRLFELYDGLIVGLLISFGWYITGIYSEEMFERTLSISSIAFVFPSANTLELFTSYSIMNVTYPISLVVGVFVGAFVMSLFNRKYSFGCTTNLQGSKIKAKFFGGALMGIGGVLAIGCTVGQGLSGLSTLAFSSLLAISSILISGYITAKFLHKKKQLPMCFIFEWKDETLDK